MDDPLEKLRGGKGWIVVSPEIENLNIKFDYVSVNFQSVGDDEETKSPGVLEVKDLGIDLECCNHSEVQGVGEVPVGRKGLVELSCNVWVKFLVLVDLRLIDLSKSSLFKQLPFQLAASICTTSNSRGRAAGMRGRAITRKSQSLARPSANWRWSCRSKSGRTGSSPWRSSPKHSEWGCCLNWLANLEARKPSSFRRIFIYFSFQRFYSNKIEDLPTPFKKALIPSIIRV